MKKPSTIRARSTIQRIEAEHERRVEPITEAPLSIDDKMPLILREVRRHLRAMIRHHDQIERERLDALKSELDATCRNIVADTKRRAAEARKDRQFIAASGWNTVKS